MPPGILLIQATPITRLDGTSLAVLARFWSTYFNSCWPVNLEHAARPSTG
jgi:hypothetical protein